MRDRTFREVKVGCLFDTRALAQVQVRRKQILHPHYEAYLGDPRRWASGCMPRRVRPWRSWTTTT
jgi:hypothetical protein